MGFPAHKPPIILISSSSSSQTSSLAPSSSSSSRPLHRNSRRRPAPVSRGERYLSPYAPVDNRARAVRERRRRRRQSQRQTHNVEPLVPRDLTTTSLLASSFQMNTSPSMSTIPFSKPLFGTYPSLFVQPHLPTTHDDRPVEIDSQPSDTNELDDLPSDLFSIEFIYNNRGLAMEVLLGNLAGDESFADLLGLPSDTYSDHSDEDDVYEDDVDLDMDIEGTREEDSEETPSERSLHGDILRGVDEDYD